MDFGENTSLHASSYTGRLEVVKYLVIAGANIEAKSDGGFTPLMRAF
jgi:ankyrin repeat protein